MGAHVVDMALQVGDAFFQGAQVFLVQLLKVAAAVVLERANRSHQHHGRGPQARLAALDINKLLGPQVSTKAGLGDHVVGQLERHFGGQHRVAAVGDIGKRAAVDEGRVVFQRLHQVGLERFAQQHRHGAMGVQIAGAHRLLGRGVANHDIAQAFF